MVANYPRRMASAVAGEVDDDAVDLRVYLAVLGRRWKVVVVVLALAVVGAVVLSITQSTRYRATAELLFQTKRSDTFINDASNTDVNGAARQLNNEVQLFESEHVEAAVAKAYQGPLDPEDVKASVVSDSADLVRASLVSSNAREGAKLVNLYAATFIQVRQEQQVDELLSVGSEIQRKIDDLTTSANQIRAPLDDLDRQVAAAPGNANLSARRDSLAAQLSSQLTPLESQRAFFQSQLEQLDLIADVTSSSGATVVRAAKAEGAVSPKPARDLAVALVLGLVLGVGLAFLVDTLDERVRNAQDLERVAGGLPTLALVPEVPNQGPAFVAARDDAQGLAAEAFRSLRTALKFAALDEPFRVVQVTSPTAGEGKTTAVANLAIALAQGGDRVAVVCCDLRRPRLQERFGVELEPGFTDVLLGDVDLNGAVQRTSANVYVVSAGSPAPNPSELLSTEKAEAVVRSLAQQVDIVLLDCPPVLPVTDALVVSRMADATVVVADSRSTERRAIRRTLQQLHQVGAPVVGIVLNGLPEGAEYGYGYGYSSRYTSSRVTAAASRT
jgi:capsular exopolysaccharide synthesis family protein